MTRYFCSIALVFSLFAASAGVLSGCEVDTFCTASALQCSPLKNRIEQCNAAGTAVETIGQCPGNTCVASEGSASCDDETEPVCTPGARQCSPLLNRIEVCNADGTGFEDESNCQGNTCVVEGATVRCDDPEPDCVAGQTRCDPARPQIVEECKTTADGWFTGTTCVGVLTCVEVTGAGAQCQTCMPGSTYCGANNASVDVCNSAGTAIEAGGACTNNSCKFNGEAYGCEYPCTPGATRCGLANQTTQTCNAAGDKWETSESCLNNSCRGPIGSAACEEVPICTNGQRRCSAVAAQVVEKCNVQGTGWFENEVCRGLLECAESQSGSGVCQACVPGATRCGSGNALVEVCNAGGTAYVAGDACSGGSCKYLASLEVYACEYPCTPGLTRCGQQNQTVQACNEAGSAYALAERCVNNSCTTAAGSAACAQPEVCSPGTRRCSSGAANQVEQCSNDGSGWYTQSTCGGALQCIGSGTCQSCVPGSRMCGANNASVSVCNAGGTAFVQDEVCNSNSCGFRDGAYACEFPCSPGESRCAFNRSKIEVCAATGASYAAGEACLNNTCGSVDGVPVCGATPVCTPGARRCSATTPGVIEQCRTTADGWYTQTTCGGALQCSTATGSAACQTCNPGATRCGASNAATEVCNAAGTAYVAGDSCGSNSCKIIDGQSACEFPCSPGATRCSSQRTQVQVCNSAGSAYSLSEGCLLNSCATSGASAFCQSAQVCTPGTRRCSATATNKVEQCTVSGDGWYAATTCAGSLQCTLTASGIEGCQACIPGSRYCGANNGSVMECNQTGTAFVNAGTCTDNSCTNKNGAVACELPCTPGKVRCSALRNRVETCNGANTAYDAGETCAENTCSEALGSAFCTPPAVECVGGETRCSPLGTVVQVCSGDGRFVSGDTCPSADCRVINGAAGCAQPVCQPNVSFCGDDGDLHYCTSNGRDGGVRTDCTAAQSCRVLDGAAQCVAPEVPMSCVPNVQFCGDDGAIYYCNSAGQVSGIRAQYGVDEVCVYDAGAPMCLGGYYEEGPDGSVTCVVTEPSACVIIPTGGTQYGYVFAETEKLSCDEDGRVTRECAERMNCVDGSCTSSVSDESSPWYQYSCPLVQQLAIPTDLQADCRCLINNAPLAGLEVCGRPFDRATGGLTVGTGPRIFGLANAHFSGGFIEGNEIVVAVYWGSSTAQRGAVMAVDVDSGNRRLISGDLSSVTAGSGPAFSYALDVRKGVDGNYYVFTQSTLPGAPSIFRVNPTTGVRTLVWKGQGAGFGQCAAGDPNAAANGIYVQYTNQGFAVDAAGGFLLGYANPIRDGRGLVRISADGTTCSYVSATGTRADGLTRGTGPNMGGFVQGFMVDGGKVVVQITQPKALIEIDLTTGNRTALFTSTTAGNIGERWAVKDTARGVIWTAGVMNSVTVIAYDRAKNKTMSIFSSCGDPDFPWFPLCAGTGPIKINSLNHGGMWLHPTNGNLLFGHDSISIVEFEPETGNSIIRSL